MARQHLILQVGFGRGANHNTVKKYFVTETVTNRALENRPPWHAKRRRSVIFTHAFEKQSIHVSLHARFSYVLITKHCLRRWGVGAKQLRKQQTHSHVWRLVLLSLIAVRPPVQLHRNFKDRVTEKMFNTRLK